MRLVPACQTNLAFTHIAYVKTLTIILVIRKNSKLNVSNCHINADSLNDYYAAISTTNDYHKPTWKNTSDNSNHVPLIDTNDVMQELTKLKNTARGPDDIPCWFLKVTKHYIARHLTNFYNASLQISYIPSSLKKAIITAVPKVSHLDSLTHYRPISVTSIII